LRALGECENDNIYQEALLVYEGASSDGFLVSSSPGPRGLPEGIVSEHTWFSQINAKIILQTLFATLKYRYVQFKQTSCMFHYHQNYFISDIFSKKSS